MTSLGGRLGVEESTVTRRSSGPASPAMPIALRAWAGIWAVLLALLFVGVTALTLGVWLSDSSYTATSPVSDLAFFALGATIVIGFASQVMRRTAGLAGAAQALIGALALAAAGFLGNRIEPLVGGVVLVAAAGVLLAFHPERHRASLAAVAVSRPLAAVSLIAVLPAIWYAAQMLELARAAGPSCFLGQCVTGDRYAEMAAVAVTIPLHSVLASLRLSGWRVPLWTAGAAGLLVGAVSVVLPDAPGSLGPWGVTMLAWSILLLGVARAERATVGGTTEVGP
jgi:hypothetical protein